MSVRNFFAQKKKYCTSIVKEKVKEVCNKVFILF